MPSSSAVVHRAEVALAVADAPARRAEQAVTTGRSRIGLEDLNPEQRRAALHDGRSLLVVAGAGSGKTRTLVSRVARLLDDGTPPERILLLTFTRRASSEMLRRVRALGLDDARRVTGGTFHAVAHATLRRQARAVGLPPGFTVLDPGDVTDLISIVRTEEGLGERGSRFPRARTIAEIGGRVSAAQEPLSEVVLERFPWCREHVDGVRTVLQGFHQRKRAMGVVDFDDLLLLWRALLQHAEAGPALAGAFDHVLVDEFQDTNAVQADIVAALHRHGASVTCVGDDAQAIYGFRGATVENIRMLPTRLPETEVITLHRNYRSTPEILASANALLRSMPDAFEKELTSVRPTGPSPQVVISDDEGDQAEAISLAVLDARERGVALKEQAVLFRTGHHADLLEVELGLRDIPFVKFGGLKFLDRAHVKDLRAVLRVLDNPGDELAWDRILRLLPGVGPGRARAAMEALRGEGPAQQDGPSGDDPLRRFLDGRVSLPASTDVEVGLLVAAWAFSAGDDGRAPEPGVQIDALRPFCARVWSALHEDAPARLSDLDQLATLAGRHGTRSAFLGALTLDPPVSTSDLAGPPHLDDDHLVLSTIHSAKGGEWKHVHVMHAVDGAIPSDMALRNRDELEEERRLFYVALTRARDELTVHVPLRFHHDGPKHHDRHSYAQPSRFLAPLTETTQRVDQTRPAEAVPRLLSARTAIDDLVTGLLDG